MSIDYVARDDAVRALKPGSLASRAAMFGRLPMRGSFLGDSIASGTYNFTAWVNANCPALMMGENAGLGGNTSTQMLARVGTDVSTDVDFAFVMEAANDASNGVTLAQHVTNMRGIFANLIGRNILPVLLLAPSKDTNTLAVQQFRLADLVLALQLGVPVYDAWEAFINAADGHWTAAASGDGTHPTTATAKTAGTTLGTNIATNVIPYLRPLCNANTPGLVSGPLFMVDTNADGLADGWNKYGTCTASLASASGDGYRGNYQSCAGTAAGAGVYADIFTGVVVGNLLFATAVIDTTVVSGSPTFSAFMRFTGGGLDKYLISPNASVANRFRASVLCRVPAGSTAIKFQFQVDGTASPAGTIKIAEAQVFDVTAALAGA